MDSGTAGGVAESGATALESPVCPQPATRKSATKDMQTFREKIRKMRFINFSPSDFWLSQATLTPSDPRRR
jgi:hypothetical protein